MNVDEIEVRIREKTAKLAKLEEAYENEEDERKINKMEYSMSRLEENIESLVDRQQNLLDREAKDEEKENPKDKDADDDDEVCLACGGDLQQIGEENGVAILECLKCHELYLDD